MNDGKLMDWADYLDLLKPAGDLIGQTFFPDSEQLRAELYRQLVMNISLGYFLYFQADARHPDWTPFLNSVFMLQPNPDDTYYNAPLHDSGIYRIVGDRGGVLLLTFSLGTTVMGTSSDGYGKSLAYVDIDDLEIAADGRFEFILSAARPAGHTGNWVPMPPQTGYILFRMRSYDWAGERDARLAIERLDAPAIKPRQSVAAIDQCLRDLLGGFTARLSQMWLAYQNMQFDKGLVNRFELTDFGGTIPPQWYWQGLFQLESDEALILETELPETRKYWNMQLNDELWNTIDFIHRQSSLNGHQAQIDGDGKFRAVISFVDPGIANWLDPAETRQGMLIGRWYGCSSHPIPTLKRVKSAELRQHLPPDTPQITAEQRATALRERRIGAQLRRRW